MKLSVLRIKIMQFIESHGTYKTQSVSGIYSLAVWSRGAGRAPVRWAACPDRWAHDQDTPGEQCVHWDGILGWLLPKSKQQSVQSHSFMMKKPTWLRTLPSAAPATRLGHSRAESRFIHEITRQTWVVSRRFCGKAVRQSVEQLPWTKRQPVLDL